MLHTVQPFLSSVPLPPLNTGPSALPVYVALGVTSVREMGGANPLDNIRNTRRIFAVVQAGRLHSRRALDDLLRTVRNGMLPHAQHGPS